MRASQPLVPVRRSAAICRIRPQGGPNPDYYFLAVSGCVYRCERAMSLRFGIASRCISCAALQAPLALVCSCQWPAESSAVPRTKGSIEDPSRTRPVQSSPVRPSSCPVSPVSRPPSVVHRQLSSVFVRRPLSVVRRCRRCRCHRRGQEQPLPVTRDLDRAVRRRRRQCL